jgi:Lon-like protease
MTMTSSEPSTSRNLPFGEPDEPLRRRRRLVWYVGLGALLAFVLAVIGSAFVRVPYYTIRPGSVRPMGDVVVVSGTPQHPPQSPVAFTTVNLREITLLEAAASWLDPDVEVLPEDEIRQGRTPEENRRVNVQMMDTSKHKAITVALRHLGYDVHVRTAGTIVDGVLPGAPAEGVLEQGDVIVEVNGEPVDEPGVLSELLLQAGAGATHALTVERTRTGETLELEVETVGAPDDPERPMIGIRPLERIIDFEYPFDIDIDSANVSGPSAGLAFTLAVLDHLTPGELTGGARVAVTGTIEFDGTVGVIGGVPQKAVAVREAGYDAFIVPAAIAEEIGDRAGDVEVIGVRTLDEALEALASFGGNALALGEPGAARPAA